MDIIKAGGEAKPVTSLLNGLPVKLEHPDAVLPTRAHRTDAGLDLYSAETVIIKAGSQGVVNTGISVAIPEGAAGFVFIRSSVGFKRNSTLSNSVGVIDSAYRGAIKVAITNHSNIDFEVRKGDRVAQIVIIPVLALNPISVNDLPSTDRGVGGFGSSGV